jgi:CHASE2 domain-containing sensor protein
MGIILWLCLWSSVIGAICSWRFKQASVAAFVAGIASTTTFHCLQYLIEGDFGTFAVVSVPVFSFLALAASGTTVLLIRYVRNTTGRSSERDSSEFD